MTHFVEVEDIPAGKIFLAEGDKYLMLNPDIAWPKAVTMGGVVTALKPGTLCRRADKGSTITVRQL